MAMRDGLELANSLGFNHLEAESDSILYTNDQFVYRTVQMVGRKHAAATIFAKCVDTTMAIGKVIYKHCYRSSNQAAHVLANYSYLL